MSEVINNILTRFSPVTLEEMDSVDLMNRFDTKYMFCIKRLPGLLEMLASDYQILQISDERSFNYTTIYLDTLQYMFYNQHVTGKLARHKVRYRRYDSSGDSYLEVKRKTNMNKTKKWRIRYEFNPSVMDDSGRSFIGDRTRIDDLHLIPVIENRFTRATLVGLRTHERITVDFNLAFKSVDGNHIELPFLGIVEHKGETYTCHSPFRTAVLRSSLRPAGISKYCVGTAMLIDIPRKNTLKERILQINKIKNEYSESACS
jgi:hypothetical protein